METAATATSDKPLSKRHVPALDGIRGLAILVVLAHNLSIITERDTLPEKLWTFGVEAGWIGVQLFFVLSGFLITGILFDDAPVRSGSRSSPWGPGRLRRFYIRRFLRIGPLYYAFLVGYFIVLPLFFPRAHHPFSETVWYWLYLSNWSTLVLGAVPGIGHFWSLAVEEQFYLVWPWLVRLRRTVFVGIGIALVAGALVTRIVLHELDFPGVWLYASTATRVDALAMGALLAAAFRSEIWLARVRRLWLPASIASGLAIVALIGVTHGLNRTNPFVQIYGYGILAFGGTALVARAALPAATPGATPARWLEHPILLFFGKYSYGIYVLHAPLKQIALTLYGDELDSRLARSPLGTEIPFVVVLAVLTIVLAMASWTFLEKPVLKLKDRAMVR